MKNLLAKISILLSIMAVFYSSALSQVPDNLKYQAIARDNSNNPITDTGLEVKLAIVLGSPGGTVLWEEQHSITTNAFGLFSLHIGDPEATKTGGILSSFSEIEWEGGNLFLQPSIYYPDEWKDIPDSPFAAVPYALVARRAVEGQFPVNVDTVFLPEGSLAIGSDSPGGSKLAVISSDDNSEDALFEVKRADGQIVFAVYNDGIRANVAPVIEDKGRPKGGFRVGGFDPTPLKATPLNELMLITPDSTRFYIDDTNTGKGSKGGFRVGGFDRSKGPGSDFMTISGSNELPLIDSASQFLFYPLKDAFLAGTIHIGSPDSVGTNSISLGFMNTAMGQFSQAIGFKSHAEGNFGSAIGLNAKSYQNGAVAFGANALADGEYAYAVGNGAQALGYKNYAFGYGAVASGYKSYAIGSQCYSQGEVSFAFGHATRALANSSMAFGRGSVAEGYHSIAIGVSNDDDPRTTSKGSKSIAIGSSTMANANNSYALGFWLVNNDDNSVVLGSYNDPDITGAKLVVGNGNDDGNRSNAMMVFDDGSVTIMAGLTQDSDARLKEKIEDLGTVSGKIMKLNPVYYEFKDKSKYPDERQIGLLAQEIEPLFPNWSE